MTGLPSVGSALASEIHAVTKAPRSPSKKLTNSSSSQVIVKALVPSTAPPTNPVAVYGVNFGDPGPDSSLTLDGAALPSTGLDWSDTKVVFKVPAQQPTGGAWPASTDVAVGIVSDGEPSISTLSLKVTGPPASNG